MLFGLFRKGKSVLGMHKLLLGLSDLLEGLIGLSILLCL